MTSSAIALGVLSPPGLHLLCTIGSCAGVLIVLFGFWLNRKATHSSQECDSPPTDAPAIHDAPTAQSPAAAQQIIHLTSTPGPVRSSDMSQQQKIAAALGRAGISNSASWSLAESSPPITVQETAPGTSPATRSDASPADTPTQTHSSSLIRKLLLLGGSMLALIGLIAFLTIR
jgi:hypothetical protein